ncbi:MAG TPA: LysR family transcriptional regulator, partial [Polyangiaceae bacterium]|nr:LysR family transcriptional regulator [Polyangiaceae bacterium]
MFQQMTTFVRIVDAGNISRAARSLGLSVAMASRHLRWLEQELGTPLLRRTTRRVDLTEAGVEFALRARAILAGVDEAKAVVRPGRGVAGRVVLSVPPTLGLLRIAPLLPELLEKHPRLRVEIRFEDQTADLIRDGVDIAVRAGRLPPDSPFIVGRKIASFERVVCASPKF